MNRGAILIITLWILAILAILSIGIGGRMGLELKLTGFNRDSTAALYLAEAGVKRAIAVIASKKDHAVDSLNEPWSYNNDNEEAKPLFKEIKIGEAGFFTVSYPSSDKRVFYGIQDEQARVNINTAPHDVIAGLIVNIDQAVANADEIATNIEDWRGSGSNPSKYDYVDEGYERKNDLFDSVDELLLVKGVDRNLFDKIKGYITVYPRASSGCHININTAPLPVLEALGFSGDDAGKIIAARACPDTPDNTPFSSKNDFTTRLPDVTITTTSPTPPVHMELVFFESNYYRVISKGYASGGRAAKTVTCVFSVTEGEVLYWNEE